jgi:hypothetical protein
MSVDFRESVLNYVLTKSHPNDVHSVINAIDEYGWTQQALMNIGDTKGKILDAALRSRQPKTVLELGKYLLTYILINYLFLFFHQRHFSWLQFPTYGFSIT